MPNLNFLQSEYKKYRQSSQKAVSPVGLFSSWNFEFLKKADGWHPPIQEQGQSAASSPSLLLANYEPTNLATRTELEVGRNDRKQAIPHPKEQRRISLHKLLLLCFLRSVRVASRSYLCLPWGLCELPRGLCGLPRGPCGLPRRPIAGSREVRAGCLKLKLWDQNEWSSLMEHFISNYKVILDGSPWSRNNCYW